MKWISLFAILESLLLVHSQSSPPISNNGSSDAASTSPAAPSAASVAQSPSSSLASSSLSSSPSAPSSPNPSTLTPVPSTLNPVSVVSSSPAVSATEQFLSSTILLSPSSVSLSSASSVSPSVSPAGSTAVSAPVAGNGSSAASAGNDSSVKPSVVSVPATSTAQAATTGNPDKGTATPPPYVERVRGTNRTPEIVAIICGCLLSLMTVVLFTGIGLILKYVKEKELSGKPIISRRGQGDAAFYEGLHPQSAQALVGSMSNQSFAASPSDQHLNASYGQGAYFNRGFEVDQHGAHNVAVHFEKEAGGPGPIEINKGRKEMATIMESKA